MDPPQPLGKLAFILISLLRTVEGWIQRETVAKIGKKFSKSRAGLNEARPLPRSSSVDARRVRQELIDQAQNCPLPIFSTADGPLVHKLDNLTAFVKSGTLSFGEKVARFVHCADIEVV